MSAKPRWGNDKSSSGVNSVAVPSRPRNEVLDEIADRLAALEATTGELRSPSAEEVLVDFVSLMRCRLQPLREGSEKPIRTKMGGYKPFTDEDPDDAADDGVADDSAADDAIDVDS